MRPSTSATCGHRRLDFPPGDPQGCVRRGTDFSRRALADWRPTAGAMTVDNVALVAAELLTNAANHASGPTTLDLHYGPDTGLLHIAVTDTHPDPPRLRTVRPEEPHGRGMHIIDHIAAAWGHRPNGTGKTVWATLHLP